MTTRPIMILAGLLAIAAMTTGMIPTFADNSSPNAKPAQTASGALPRDAKGVPTVPLPYTFVCSHCGMKITIKTQSDWTKPCQMCACGVPAYQCLPKGK